jgi:hypothetical protein
MQKALEKLPRVGYIAYWSPWQRKRMAEDIKEILANLLERREKLSVEAIALDNLIAVYKKTLESSASESVSDSDQPELYNRPTSRAVQAAAIANAIEAARKLIISNRRPMKRGELVDILERQGFSFPGIDKSKVFGTNIWRSGKFRAVEGKGYWPKDVALPKVD